jgi:hypothetical protein
MMALPTSSHCLRISIPPSMQLPSAPVPSSCPIIPLPPSKPIIMVQSQESFSGILFHISLSYRMIPRDHSRCSPFNLQRAPQLVQPLAYALFPELVSAHPISQETVVNPVPLAISARNARRVLRGAVNVTMGSQAREPVSPQVSQQMPQQTATARTACADLAGRAHAIRDGPPPPPLEILRNATPASLDSSSTRLETAKVADPDVQNVPTRLEHVNNVRRDSP